ncbi:MAG: hypothetical protein R3E10_17980 [Gemmatimonadota bacterium]
MRTRLPALLASLTLGLAGVACDIPTAPESTADPVAATPGDPSSNGGTPISGEVRVTLSADAAFPAASGKAKYKNIGGERELQIELENGPRNTSVSFLVGGTVVADGVTDGLGNASINRNSDVGQSVPDVTTGMTIEVRIGGQVLLSGHF